MNCNFDNDAMTCPTCGESAMLLTKGELSPERCRRLHRECTKAPKRDAPCENLGAELRREKCKTCTTGEQYTVKVFACSVHGECTIGKKLNGVTCCASCSDYRPK